MGTISLNTLQDDVIQSKSAGVFGKDCRFILGLRRMCMHINSVHYNCL
jgi:hypothetical protein